MHKTYVCSKTHSGVNCLGSLWDNAFQNNRNHIFHAFFLIASCLRNNLYISQSYKGEVSRNYRSMKVSYSHPNLAFVLVRGVMVRYDIKQFQKLLASPIENYIPAVLTSQPLTTKLLISSYTDSSSHPLETTFHAPHSNDWRIITAYKIVHVWRAPNTERFQNLPGVKQVNEGPNLINLFLVYDLLRYEHTCEETGTGSFRLSLQYP